MLKTVLPVACTKAHELQKHTCAVADEEVVQAVVHAAHQKGHALHLVVVEQLPLHAKPVGHLHSTQCPVSAFLILNTILMW